MFKFTKLEFEKAFPANGFAFNYLTEFPAIMSLRTPAEFYNFKSFISKIENMHDLKSFDKIYFSLSTSEKYLFASFTRMLLSKFSCAKVLAEGHYMDSDFAHYFISNFYFYDTFLGDYTFYQTFRVLSLSFSFVHFAACYPSAFHFKPIPDGATYDKYGLQRFWSNFFPQLDRFYKK